MRLFHISHERSSLKVFLLKEKTTDNSVVFSFASF